MNVSMSKRHWFARSAVLLMLVVTMSTASVASAQENREGPPYLQDRGTGVATSMFGTYVQKGELLVYPFFEA